MISVGARWAIVVSSGWTADPDMAAGVAAASRGAGTRADLSATLPRHVPLGVATAPARGSAGAGAVPGIPADRMACAAWSPQREGPTASRTTLAGSGDPEISDMRGMRPRIAPILISPYPVVR